MTDSTMWGKIDRSTKSAVGLGATIGVANYLNLQNFVIPPISGMVGVQFGNLVGEVVYFSAVAWVYMSFIDAKLF